MVRRSESSDVERAPLQPARRPSTRRAFIVAQDPSIRNAEGKVVLAEIEIPAEVLDDGPCGYRVNVVDYDVSNNILYRPALTGGDDERQPLLVSSDPAELLADPRQHAINAYAVVMRILSRFEFALGRRVAWGSDGHQLHISPHAFAEPGAFYARAHRGIFLGYFEGVSGEVVFTSLSHDIVAHETTHALLDGLRRRYLEPSSPDQAAFHEGFSDIVALLSVFALRDLVATLLSTTSGPLIEEASVTREALRNSVFLGLADQMGQELPGSRGDSLRRSVKLDPRRGLLREPEFLEEHRRGEVLVAAFLNAFLDIWESRIAKLGFIQGRQRDRSMVAEEGARVADHLLTMAIRALDYAPPTDITFRDYLSALLTIDREVVPDDSRYGYRGALLKNFKAFGIRPSEHAERGDGTWKLCDAELNYGRSRFDSLVRDREEVFRFLWENREKLDLGKKGYIEVQSVRPATRVGPDGFILRETVAEYVQVLDLEAGELRAEVGIMPPPGVMPWVRLRLFAGGALIFDEYGRLKYHIANRLGATEADRKRQAARLRALDDAGMLQAEGADTQLARMHLARGVGGRVRP